VDDEPDYPETEITLPAKSRLLLYTDGIIEEQGPNGTFFELEGLSQAIIASRSLSPQGAVDAVIQSLHAFSQRTRSRDDVTLLVMDVTGR
jgi:serine phosphatase RsbU (regulator of sigma subunit)